jgi:hypothetical protein
MVVPELPAVCRANPSKVQTENELAEMAMIFEFGGA